MNKSFTKGIVVINCQNCGKSLNQIGNAEFIVRCGKCSWINKFSFGALEENEKTIMGSFKTPILFKKQYGGGFLYTYRFDRREIDLFKRISQKSGEALDKLILYGKDHLSNQEKNILYKLKASSISKIQEKIDYLEAKKNVIEGLRLLEY